MAGALLCILFNPAAALVITAPPQFVGTHSHVLAGFGPEVPEAGLVRSPCIRNLKFTGLTQNLGQL
jgi:hypothetical protein